jgi:CBS domain containing-hemolysin-like protein
MHAAGRRKKNMSNEIFIAALICFVWFYCAREAFAGISRGRIRRIETANPNLAKDLERWHDRPGEYSAIFNTVLFLAMAVIAVTTTSLVEKHTAFLSGWREASILGIILIFLLLTGAVSRIVNRKIDMVLLRLTIPVITLLRQTILRPVASLLKTVEDTAETWQHDHQDEPPSAEDEIMSLVEQEHVQNGQIALEEDEKEMIRGIFDLDNTPVREIMTPRVDMISLPGSSTVKEARERFVTSGHSRIPVYQNNIDEIKGMLYAKDFLANLPEEKHCEEFAHKPLFVPETKNVGDLLHELKNNSIHVAIIIDEYGGTSGIVSLEDILEEIVGEIRDEYDSEADTEVQPEKMADGSIVTEGRSLISDINELLGTKIPEDEDVDTVGGYVCGHLGRIPEAGEILELKNIAAFTVIEADHRKIVSLRITPPVPSKHD